MSSGQFEPATHPPLTEIGARLRELAGDAAFKAGRDYLRKGNVKDGAVAESSAYATVTGSTDYRVTIVFPSADATKVTCTCPAHRRSKYCKHVVAVCSALLEQPATFAVLDAMPAPPTSQKTARAPRSKAPKTQPAEMRATGLEVLDRLLLELTDGGLAQLGPEKVSLIEQCAELVRALKLRRLGNLLMQLRRAVANPEQANGATFSRLLRDLYLTRTATGAHLDGKAALDPRLAEDLLGKTWRAEELEQVGGFELIQVASSIEGDGEFTVESAYLIDPASADMYVERQITPSRLRRVPKAPHRVRLEVEEAGLYPGLSPRRIRLNRTKRTPLPSEDIDRLLEGATADVAAIQRRLVERSAVPFGQAEVATLFSPAAVLIPPKQPANEGNNAGPSGAANRRFRLHENLITSIGVVDAAGRFMAVEIIPGLTADLQDAVAGGARFALFGLATLREDAISMRCLSIVGASSTGAGRHRFGRISPE